MGEIRFVGLDVHKESIAIAVAEQAGGPLSSAAVKGVIRPRRPAERRPSLSRVGAGYAESVSKRRAARVGARP
jgi:hypothetical protein